MFLILFVAKPELDVNTWCNNYIPKLIERKNQQIFDTFEEH